MSRRKLYWRKLHDQVGDRAIMSLPSARAKGRGVFLRKGWGVDVTCTRAATRRKQALVERWLSEPDAKRR